MKLNLRRCFEATDVGVEEVFPEEVAFELDLAEWWACPRRRRTFQAEGKGYAQMEKSLFLFRDRYSL